MTQERSAEAGAVRFYSHTRRLRRRLFTEFLRRGFASFGSGSSLAPPLEADRASEVAIGTGTVLGPFCTLRVLGNRRPGVRISIGDRVSVVGWCAISAIEHVEICDGALFARGVYIADHTHAFDDVDRFVKDQGLKNIAPVRIGRGAWLGENVVISPGVEVGDGAVIAANSVVRHNVPPHTLAAGAPARVVRTWTSESPL